MLPGIFHNFTIIVTILFVCWSVGSSCRWLCQNG